MIVSLAVGEHRTSDYDVNIHEQFTNNSCVCTGGSQDSAILRCIPLTMRHAIQHFFVPTLIYEGTQHAIFVPKQLLRACKFNL